MLHQPDALKNNGEANALHQTDALKLCCGVHRVPCLTVLLVVASPRCTETLLRPSLLFAVNSGEKLHQTDALKICCGFSRARINVNDERLHQTDALKLIAHKTGNSFILQPRRSYWYNTNLKKGNRSAAIRTLTKPSSVMKLPLTS